MRTNLTFVTKSRELSPNIRGFELRRVCLWYFSGWYYVDTLVWSILYKKNENVQRSDGSILCGKLGVDIFSTSEIIYPNMKIRQGLIGTKPKFYMINDNSNVRFADFDCSFYIRLFALGDVYHMKQIDIFTYTSLEFNYWKTLVKTFILPERQNLLIQENIFNSVVLVKTVIHFVRLMLQLKQTLPSLDHTLKIQFGITNLISNKFKYSKKANRRLCWSYLLSLKCLNNESNELSRGCPSTPVDNFKNHWVLVVDLESK